MTAADKYRPIRSLLRIANFSPVLGLCWLLLSLNTSCSLQRTGCCTVRAKVGCPLNQVFRRRPPVMVHYSPVVVDYAPDDCGAESRYGKGEEIPPEYLDPYNGADTAYTVTIGDVLEVSVFTSDENFSSEVVVAPDGRLYYMYLDGIEADGKEPDEIAQAIEEGLGEILASPSVAVVPKVKAADYYLVMGKVRAPGVYPLQTAVDLRSAIGEAGGVVQGRYLGSTTQLANLSESFVVRDGQRLNIDFAALINEGREDQNIFLQPGDYVYIASGTDDEIYMLGAIGGRVRPFKDGLTLVGALTPAYGAWVDSPYARGDWSNVLIIRGSLDCPCVIRADFLTILSGDARDIYLSPGDIIYVPNQRMRFGKALIRLALDAFISAFVSASASHHVNQVLGD